MRTTLLLCLLLSSAASASSIDKELVARIIRRQNPAFHACYETALKSEIPGVSGKANLKIAINSEGKVTQVDVDFPQPAEKFTTCLRDAAMELRFPKFGPGEPIKIMWPIVFAAP